MIEHLSYSSLSVFLRCPKSFYFRYLEKKPEALKGRVLCGRTYHHTLAVAELRRQLFNEQITPNEVGDIFSSHWEKECQNKLVYDELGDEKVEATVLDFEDDDPGELKDSGIKLAQLYIEKVLPTLDIVAIEKRMTANVDGVPFVGYADLILKSDIVIDHKFAQRKMPQGDADKDIQISSYALLLNKPITGQFHQALDTKEKSINIVETKRDRSDIDWLKQIIVGVWEQINSGLFYCNPLGWWCGENSCSWWLECKHPNL
jgi:hypothetical protein